MRSLTLLCALVFACAPAAAAQDADALKAKAAALAAAEREFKAGNLLFEQGKYAEALARYREGLRHVPDDTSLLYNGGTAALIAGDYAAAVGMLKQVRETYPEDWQTRAKLVQAYQGLGDLKARDAERAALFDLRKHGGGGSVQDPEMSLVRQDAYCRERFDVGGHKGMIFEHFELKGDRALRYAFVVLDEAGQKEEFRISLGSYDTTNSFWAASNKEQAGKGGRLFHLDGYYEWGHATYGMYHPEPSYDEVRKIVFDILANKRDPVSSSTRPRPSGEQAKPADEKKP